jgi:hypothetical protein
MQGLLVSFLPSSVAYYCCFFVSIELRCEMKQLEMLYADRVGYNVGGRLMTASTLMKLL